ncbi:VanZ family protein [Chryseobacterium pennipullorum]|uniref:VanZ family protein n=1 Tax=Chryseobacterium pennipullorum TaxID=2258963 RepID=A0A3D9B2T8_9FLAO|nr:VanZ family protein [Chryseobacterium pennipullorum]REC47941.1 VanZ family protein [Chryseobacterium pennipullorum]
MLKKVYKILIVPYTLFLLYLMFLGMGRFQYEDHLIRVEPVFSTIEFIKNTIRWEDIIRIVLGNITMFIPFGFLGWALPALRDLKTLIFSFVSAIVIVEALHYFTRMGIFELDDVMLNTFGVYLGWLCCRWIEKRINC